MNPWRSISEMPREVWSIFGATLVNRSGTMVLPFLALYVTRALGFSESEAGVVLMTYGVGALVASPLSGRLADRIGSRRIMVLSLLLSGVLLLALSVARMYAVVLAGMFAWGMVSEAYRPASLAITSELVAPELRKSAIVLNRLAVNVGMSIGPAVGGFLAAWSFSALFAVDAITSIGAGIVLFIFLRRRQAPVTEGSSGRTNDVQTEVRSTTDANKGIREVFHDRRFMYFLIAIIPVVVVFFQSGSTMSLYIVQNLKMPESAYGILIMLNTLIVIVFEIPLNHRTARWSYRKTLSLGAFLLGAGLGGLVLVRGFWGAAAAVAVMTVGEMIFIPTSADYIVKIAPEHSKGAYSGLYTMVFNFSFLMAVLAGTQVLQRLGPELLWLSAFGLGLVSTIMLLKIGDSTPPLLEDR